MTTFEERCTEACRPLLEKWDLSSIESHRDAVYALTPDLRLAYFNEAWLNYASDNGSSPAITSNWPLGRRITDAIPEPLQRFYRELFATALASARDEKGQLVRHEYECSSPDTYRRFLMQLYWLPGATAVLVVNSKVAEMPALEAGLVPSAPDKARYSDAQGIIRQCCHCRRIQASPDKTGWDWVPDWVEKPPAETSHTLCNFCLDFYYPNDD